MRKRRNYARALLRLAAPPTWSASLVPMAVGYGAAFSFGSAALTPRAALWIFISIVAMGQIETGKHGVNELVDYATGNDAAVDAEHKTPFTGGKKVLVPGLVSPKAVLVISLCCFILAGGLGLSIVLFHSFHVLWFGVVGIVISIVYSLPPFKLIYRGLGEVAVGITYGPLVVGGVYTVFAVEFSPESWIMLLAMGLHLGFLIANVLVINEYPDYEADVYAGKYNLLARVGKERGVIWHKSLFLASYIPIIFLIVYTGQAEWALSLFLVPLMWKSNRICARYREDIPSLMKAIRMTILIHIGGGVILFVVLVMGGGGQ